MSASRSTSQAEDPAVPRRGQPQPLDLVAAVVHGHVALGPGLGPLHRPAELARDQQRQHLFRGDLELRPEAAAHVRRDHPQLVLGDAGDEREHDPQHVRDLRGRPQGVLVGDRGAHHRARLHGRRDQPLLPVGALQYDRRVAERGLQVAVVERPGERLVPGLVDFRGSRASIAASMSSTGSSGSYVTSISSTRVGGGVLVAGDDGRRRSRRRTARCRRPSTGGRGSRCPG